MNKQQVFSLAVCFCLVYTLAYLITEMVQVPIFWYYPKTQVWFWGLNPPAGLKMGWFGKVFFAIGLASVVAATLAMIYKVFKWQPGEDLQGFLDLAMMSSLLFTMYFIAYYMFHPLNAA